jgi:hypothetical protein
MKSKILFVIFKMEYLLNAEQNFKSEPYIQIASSTWPILPLTIVSIYIGFIFVAPQLMKNREPFQFKTSVALWNLLLSIFSFCGMVRTLPYSFFITWSHSTQEIICNYPYYIENGPYGMWTMLFVFSKIAELLDTVFLVLKKKKLVFLHWYHHATVLILTWHAYISKSPTSIYFMSMNYSIHSFMYGYYFLQSIGKWPRWLSPRFITIAQISQMIVGSLLCFISIFYKLYVPQCFVPTTSMFYAGVIYTTYLLLFSRFFFKRFLQPKSKII